MRLFKVADRFEQKLKKYASYPTPETVKPIVEEVLNTVRASNKQILGSVKEVSKVDVQTNFENTCFIYFQLVVDPIKYNYLMEEPQKSLVTYILKEPMETALKTRFATFEFKVKIGIVPV